MGQYLRLSIQRSSNFLAFASAQIQDPIIYKIFDRNFSFIRHYSPFTNSMAVFVKVVRLKK